MKFGHIDRIPTQYQSWQVRTTNPATLSATLQDRMADALLFRTLATLRTDIDVFEDVDDLRWAGPTPAFAALAAVLDANVKRESGRGGRLRV